MPYMDGPDLCRQLYPHVLDFDRRLKKKNRDRPRVLHDVEPDTDTYAPTLSTESGNFFPSENYARVFLGGHTWHHQVMPARRGPRLWPRDCSMP